MSKIIKTVALLFSLSSFLGIFAQNPKNSDPITIFLDLKDKSLESYSINKDTTVCRFSIYKKEYESKKARNKAQKEYDNRIGDPNSAGMVRFSIALYAFNRKPERLESLEGINYITIKQFREEYDYITTSPTYIIHKLKDGTYLKWKTYTME
jgi:hypothetical protein